eukprot:c26207_g1_i1 orf=147-614(-)
MASVQEEMVVEVPIKHPASVVWKVFMHDFQNCLPTVLPGHFHSIQHTEGPPMAPGSVFVATYGEDVSHYEFIKLKWDEMNHEKLTFKCTLIEGGALGKHFTHLSYTYNIISVTQESCLMHITVGFNDIGEHTFHDFIKDELVKFCTSLESHITSL